MNTTNLKGVMKNQDIKDSFFQNLDNFYIYVYTLLYTKL